MNLRKYNLLFLFLFCPLLPSSSENRTTSGESNYVLDSPSLLSSTEKAEINTLCGQLEKEIGSQIVVDIISTTGAKSIEE